MTNGQSRSSSPHPRAPALRDHLFRRVHALLGELVAEALVAALELCAYADVHDLGPVGVVLLEGESQQ